MKRLLILALAVVAVGCADLVAGRALGPSDVWRVLSGGGDPLARHIVLELRLPRTLVALGAGACLGLAGTVLQAALRNPLAGPEVTGVTPGAVLGAVAATGLGLAGWESPAAVVAAAMIGGFAGAGLLWLLAGREADDPVGTAVYGVLVSAVLSGLTAMVLLVAPGELGSVVQWLVGSTEGRVWDHWTLLWPWALLWASAAWTLAAPLTLLRCGDEQAAALGLRTGPARVAALVCAVALTAGAVAAVGALGFVGLLVPHLAFALFGAGLRVALPGAALLGAGVVCGADAAAQWLSRLLAGMTDTDRLSVPTGALTTGVGAVLLLLVARRSREEGT
ncbi:iron chelate uptake ABC transporter family permease subunit [Streptomyces sp. SID4919]|uniref:FecCD family ABC transporter permease n=1 Tax=unclassified Streptomyces TaxID=2593676 RepID=UPI000823966C|nr:iron ABC transporter permease [Streptomyces sp. AmelKG-E11A]MYY07779.1 iron chelate uptake ABC transporter family permease subunit [Streptomyces sp. SID4919]SCK05558.1 iron complex transport system permease protein [Streptomyces sp. AmelKG-E11A]